MKLIGLKLKTVLFLKPTNRYQLLDPTFCQVKGDS